MDEPWLDSLSEDWNSEPRLSSPASSLANSRYDSKNSQLSQSRIPHLAHSMRRESSGGSFLKPRSSRGIAKAKGLPILSERSASSLNLPGNSLHDGSFRRVASTMGSRRVSSNLSSSQQSVQHHAIDQTSNEPPEWKKRMQNGEEVASDGFDLFSPSKLEGMFSHPAQSTPDQENQPLTTTNEGKPWTSLAYSNLQPSVEKYQSFRTSRSRAPPMAALLELSDEDNDQESEHSTSAISSELARNGSIRGLVRRRVSDFEQAREIPGSRESDVEVVSPASKDPRWRTLSGQQELRNEYISPVTASTKNTISAKAMQETIDLNPEVLKRKLMDATSHHERRPSSRSSDRDISYNGHGLDESLLHEESLQDVTSHSLPEDLTMGTQDFMSQGGYVNPRRGPGSHEASFLRKKLSSDRDISSTDRRPSAATKFRSSPPPYGTTENNSFVNRSNDDVELPSSFNDGSVVHHDTSPQRPVSVGSPLKLFGNRDTYTNNKLLRVLSQFEHDRSGQSQSSEDLPQTAEPGQTLETGLRMSQFGQGELDTYNFEKEVTRPSPVENLIQIDEGRVFQSFADLTIDDEGTIPGTRPFAKDFIDTEIEDANMKRLPSSPARDRTSKRRRTLLREELVAEDVVERVQSEDVSEKSSLAGTKRKDAKSGEGGVQADPEVLASRLILQPVSGSRKSSGNSQQRSVSQHSTIKRIDAPDELAEALAIELASFAQGVTKAQLDSRKPSLATKDYMEEANKVMEFIRARGKSRIKLPEIPEPDDLTDLEADRILDLEIEDDSTVEPFSRPPSREGPVKPREDRRIAHHDPSTANHLRKFKDSDDLELLASTSVVGTLHLPCRNDAKEAPLSPVLANEQESSPPNIRILNAKDSHRKRKHSTSTNNDQINTIPSSGISTRQTFTTETSNSSGHKGMITHGKVSIPDNIGTMTFDHEKQIWIKQHLAKIQRKESRSQHTAEDKREEATLDDDPFEDIPDLSIDEEHEAALKLNPTSSSRPSTADTVQAIPAQVENDPEASNNQQYEEEEEDVEKIQRSPEMEKSPAVAQSEPLPVQPASVRSEASLHEERLHQGIPSKVPPVLGTTSKQPRVVTIAFSSPVASGIPPPVVEVPAPMSDDEDFLPPDDSEDDTEYLRTPKAVSVAEKPEPVRYQRSTSTSIQHRQYHSNTMIRRPVSRIDEHDEEAEKSEEKSLVCVKESQMATPNPVNQMVAVKTMSAYKGTSILCLTPLSEFTMHQADRANHPEESFVQERANPKALLQAHGALALSRDHLVKAITDAIPDEPFWEQLRRLELRDSRLQSVHGLQEYCSGLEALDVSQNQITQLDGIPPTLRQLDISHNQVNDFTSWGQLENLQYVDVSNNQLETLEGFSSLIHMRKLQCCENNIHDIEGVLDLDGLISLDLRRNQLNKLDFEGVDMPRLEELDLSDNKLTTVRNLHCLPQLKILNLSGNSLRDLDVPEPLACLRTLTISHNELESLDLAKFPALAELNLDSNCIKTLTGFPNAPNLRRLSLCEQRNSASIVEFVLTTPNECQEILLSSNVVPQSEIKLPRYPHYNLRLLEMAACGLRSLPTGFGDYFPNCRTLNLNFNAISELSPLLGIVKLQRLFVASNRIKRLRRTCLTLSRIPTLAKVDMRHNPLTVGFYSPDQCEETHKAAYLLPRRLAAQDVRWLELLDETTALKRKMVELLLVQGCQMLKELDGLPFNKDQISEQDAIWSRLTSQGVLVRMIAAPPVRDRSPSAVEMPVDGTMLQKEQLPAGVDDDYDVHGHILAQERSLTVD